MAKKNSELDIFSVDTWRIFRIMSEFIEGFEELSKIGSAVSIFGSAQTKRNNKYYKLGVDIAERVVKKGFSVITGGGPGIMEAVNKGASRIKTKKSIGLNIDLPFEQKPNPYIGKIISFRYFFCRKVMFSKYASAIVILPGGYGTLDEFFEIVTLIQTKKIKPLPVILVGKEFWQGLLDWLKEKVLKAGNIAPADLKIFKITDDPAQVLKYIETFYKNKKKKNGSKFLF
ncbi:TIGR00730 family Rossman fold protein [Candidatus Auribacterota bacterium]